MKKRRIRRRPVPDVPNKRGLFLLPKPKRTFDFQLQSIPITGTPRKLRVRWDTSNPTETFTNEHGVTYNIWH